MDREEFSFSKKIMKKDVKTIVISNKRNTRKPANSNGIIYTDISVALTVSNAAKTNIITVKEGLFIVSR